MKDTIWIFFFSSKLCFLLLSSLLFCLIVLMVDSIKHSFWNLNQVRLETSDHVINKPHSATAQRWREESSCTTPGPPQSVWDLLCLLHQKNQYQKRPQRSLLPGEVSEEEDTSVDTLGPSPPRWRMDDSWVPPLLLLHTPVSCPHLSGAETPADASTPVRSYLAVQHSLSESSDQSHVYPEQINIHWIKLFYFWNHTLVLCCLKGLCPLRSL